MFPGEFNRAANSFALGIPREHGNCVGFEWWILNNKEITEPGKPSGAGKPRGNYKEENKEEASAFTQLLPVRTRLRIDTSGRFQLLEHPLHFRFVFRTQ